MSDDTWDYMQYQYGKGRPEEAARYSEYDRKQFLENQQAARALLAAESTASPDAEAP